MQYALYDMQTSPFSQGTPWFTQFHCSRGQLQWRIDGEILSAALFPWHVQVHDHLWWETSLPQQAE